MVLLLRQGDYEAFSFLYQSYSRPILGRIIHLVKSPEIAEEILQDLFMRIWEKRERVNPELPFKSFLFRIAQNLVYDHFRKVSLNHRFKAEFIQNNSEGYQHIEEELVFKQTQQQVMETIRTLPPQCQRVFILYKLEGKSYKEIGEMLAISKSTVNNHLTKANLLLKQQLPFYQNPTVMVCILLFNYF